MRAARPSVGQSAFLAALTLALASTGAAAVGPTVELPAGGLVFPSQDKVQVEREQLTIALDRIEITYVLRLIEQRPLSMVVAFPLPTIDMAALTGHEVAIPAYDPANPTNYVGFWTLIDGQPVEPEVDVRALAAGHIDVTQRLLEHGLSLYPLAADLPEKLADLPAATRDDMADGSILAINDGTSSPLWAMSTVFHWRVRVEPRKSVTVQHRYQPITGSAPWTPEFASTARSKYCLNADEVAFLGRRAANGKPPTVYWVHYHPSSNSWIKGASETFRLTIDKGSAGGIAATCFPGLQAATASTLEWVTTDRVDDADIDVLFVE